MKPTAFLLALALLVAFVPRSEALSATGNLYWGAADQGGGVPPPAAAAPATNAAVLDAYLGAVAPAGGALEQTRDTPPPAPDVVGCADCGPGAQSENEPPCGPNYVDNYNGGCNSTPVVYQDVECGTICGKSGTYVIDAQDSRDTDWYRIEVGAGSFTLSGIADGFPLRLFVVDDACPPGIVGTVTAASCVQTGTIAFTGPGTFVFFAAPEVFTGIPCGKRYRLTVSGPGIPNCTCATCPTRAQLEDEPQCGPDYVDSYNGGCNSTPTVFQNAVCGTICGEAGTYPSGALIFRDTDWYRITVGAGAFNLSGVADGFPLRLFVTSPACPPTIVGTANAESCVQTSNIPFTGPGTFYLFAASDVFSDVQCGRKYRLRITGPGIANCPATGIDDLEAPIAGRAQVEIRPNPFNPAATFEYTVSHSGDVVLEVYDPAGRLVRTLVDESVTVGTHAVTWDGRDQGGQGVPAGIYLYALSLDHRVVATGKAVLIK